MQNHRPLLKLFEKKAEEIDKVIGLNDNQIAALRHLIKTTFSVSNLDIEIDVNNKTITLVALDINSNKVGIKPKRPEILNKALEFLAIKDYSVAFWKSNVGS